MCREEGRRKKGMGLGGELRERRDEKEEKSVVCR